MNRVWHFIDRILLHPWTSRWGGFQAILGAGILAAGLAGGTVSLVFGFSVGWAVLTASGAALVASSGAATGIDRFRARSIRPPSATTHSDPERSYRIAIREIREELIENRETVDAPIRRGFYPTKAMQFRAWSKHHNILREHPNPEPHRVGSHMYRELRRAQDKGILFRNQSRPDEPAHTRVPIRIKLADELATELDHAIQCFDDLDGAVD